MLSFLAVLLAGAGLISAQSISSQCSTTLALLAISSEASCLNPLALAQLIAANASSSSIISPVNTWLTGLCSVGSCSNSSISDVITNVTSGCSSDLESLGFQTNDTQQLITYVQEVYPTARQVACLEDTSSGQICVTESLNGIQSATGTLTFSSILSLISKALSGQSTNIPSNVTCSDCSKAAYNTIKSGLSSLVTSDVESDVEAQCGSNFTDGQVPTEIKETATNSTQSDTNGAVGLPVFGAGTTVSALLVVASLFTFMA